MTDVPSLRPLAAVLVSAVAVAPILASYGRPNLREAWTVLAAVLKLGLVASMVPAVLEGDVYVTDLGPFVPYIDFTLRADALGVLFALLASTLWVATSFYSIGYMRGLDEHGQTRYFAAFAGSVSSAVGVAFASNLVVLYLFYELLTVATYPLVAHDETDEARAAGRKYLAYTFGGGVAVLAGTLLVVYLTSTAGTDPATTAFTAGGIADLASADPTLSKAAFALLVTGFGVKAALMPLHSWLPDAMVAPTPVSGLLHAVAVVKSGVFGVARVLLDVFGVDLVAELGVGGLLAAVAAFTLVTASVIALRQDNLKRRLAFSTVSQLSYIVLGVAVGAAAAPSDATRWALMGGLLHIPAHAFMKLTLFFCAGAIHVETHTDDISKMAGIGKRMPLTMGAFAVAAAGMAGIPLVAGFVSKYFLLVGTVSAGDLAFTAALLVSGILNIAYFWPVVYTAFFETPDTADEKPVAESPLGGYFGRDVRADGGHTDRGGNGHSDGHGDQEHAHEEPTHASDAHDHGPGWERRAPTGAESTWFMLAPILFAAAGSVVLGVIPDTAVFLRVVREIVAGATMVGVFV